MSDESASRGPQGSQQSSVTILVSVLIGALFG